jgi:hypothetical protein
MNEDSLKSELKYWISERNRADVRLPYFKTCIQKVKDLTKQLKKICQ